jgi:hypothetical protein
MTRVKWLTLLINLLGGTAVIGSYVLGLQAHPGAVDVLWSGVPQGIRPIYTADMFVAAAGYFAFTYFILLRLNPKDTRVYNRFGFGAFNTLYAGILVPSALWMPLTFLAVQQASLALVWAVRLVLALVAVASLGLLFALVTVKPAQPMWAQRLAVIGAMGFCLQTVLLDAIVWSGFFRV